MSSRLPTYPCRADSAGQEDLASQAALFQASYAGSLDLAQKNASVNFTIRVINRDCQIENTGSAAHVEPILKGHGRDLSIELGLKLFGKTQQDRLGERWQPISVGNAAVGSDFAQRCHDAVPVRCQLSGNAVCLAQATTSHCNNILDDHRVDLFFG